VKICQKCRYQNEDSMSFCVECGSPLPSPIVVNLNNPNTQSSHSAPPTNFGASKETETVVANNQARFGSNFQQSSPPTRPKSNTKIFLAVGGIGVLLLLFAVAGAAIVGYNIINKPKPTPYPTLSPTRTSTPVFSPTPVKSATPVFSPTSTPSVNTTSNGKAKFTSMRVEYNVTENGRLGMRIHVNFTTYKLKDVECYLLVSFLKKDGTTITAGNDTYKGPDGQVAVYASLTPGYDEAIYKDAVLFMPYDELNVGKGKFNLKMDVDLIYKNGDNIEHFNFYPFEYEEK
jgi:hypothetical protein